MSKSLKETIQSIKPLDKNALSLAAARQETLTKPTGSLGRLEELSIQIAGIQGKALPSVKQKAVIVMVADHGVVAEGTSAYPQEVTAQMVLNFVRGGAGINVIARQIGARVVVVDIGIAGKTSSFLGILRHKIAPGTQNMCLGPAMTLDQATKSLETGIAIVQSETNKGLDIVATGEMGIGNTTSASAITAIFTKKSIEQITGKGAGLDESGLNNKIAIIKKSLLINNPDSTDAIDVLSKVGGFEIAGLVGIILAAAAHKVPIVIDGFISGAAALIAYQLEPKTKNYMITSHCSVETGHKVILEYIGLKPLLDLNLRLGEGTGAALGIGLADAAVKILTQMATFKSAGVSERDK